jgi:hypothetical protein
MGDSILLIPACGFAAILLIELIRITILVIEKRDKAKCGRHTCPGCGAIMSWSRYPAKRGKKNILVEWTLPTPEHSDRKDEVGLFAYVGETESEGTNGAPDQ